VIKVLVVDDSAYNRVTITRMLESHPAIKVIGTAVNGEDGIKQLMRLTPDVVTLDLEMPVLDGFAFLRWVMANRPTAVIVVSSRTSDRNVFKALELGALDFVPKPGGRVSPRLKEIESDLVAKVLQVVALRIDNLSRLVKEHEAAAEGGQELTCDGGIDLVAIGASTGGPPALQLIFESLPKLPLPFVIAQHMPPTFTRIFAERLNHLSDYQFKEAEDGEPLQLGCAYVAPGGMLTAVQRDRDRLHLRISSPSTDDLYAPSVDLLFRSASEACGGRLISVILTGMGDDGAEATKVVRDRGGRTIAESAETAIIFGMPAEAIETGAVEHVVPLRDISAVIHRLCRGS
jgi:two-component system chemotaxis response regulator CheB